MWEKSLSDLVKGIRDHKKDEAQYISSCIKDIKEELKSKNNDVKAQAVLKLLYLRMIGYDMDWASFHIVELMSLNRFVWKRVGYLAASQSFHDGTEVSLLTTNIFKKDLKSGDQYCEGLALNALANICTTDLARDLVKDVTDMLPNSRAYVRKRAVLVMYKIFLKFPEALRPAFPLLKDRLTDVDPGVVCAAVHVICELALKNPKNFKPLAPTLYQILTSSQNSWILIKVVKLMGMLLPHEERLVKKLVEPITHILRTTPAISLIYECINTATTGMRKCRPLIELCVDKLKDFLKSDDKNLRYLGLIALNRLIKV